MISLGTLKDTTLGTPERLAFVDALQDFAVRECGTRAQRDALTDGGTTLHSADIHRKLADLGYLGVAIAEEHGGSGGGVVDACLMIEEIHAGLLPVEGVITSLIVARAYEHFGTPEQREQHLSAIRDGGIYAIAMSEPNAGSDVAALSCRAEPLSNGGYRLNGQKTWISNVHLADHVLVICRSGSAADRHRGMSMIGVDPRAPGVDIRPISTMGGDIVNDLYLTDVEVPAEALLGTEGQGWQQLTAGLNFERLLAAAASVGSARRIFGDLREYLVDRRQFDRPLAAFQSIAHRLADIATEFECSRLLTYDVARRADEHPGRVFAREASMAKLKASELHRRVALDGLQMMGGYGYATEYDMESHVRSALPTTIYGGASEIQLDIIARTLELGERR